MDEFSFIQMIKQNTYRQSGLIKGIDDDAAVFRQSYQDIVTSVDTFVENIHFSSKTMKAFHIGYRALAANISDMAAMGADPKYYLISIVIPKHWSEQKLLELYKGMNKLAEEYKIDLIGGDTVSGNELVLSITIIGGLDEGGARYRSSALVGDIVFVTGTLGDSAGGLHVLTDLSEEEHNSYTYLIDRHRMPTPRINMVNDLGGINRLALNDISDGIANEAAEIAEASNTNIHLIYEQLPQSKDLQLFPYQQQKDWKLFGGEDFELLGTVSEKDWPLVVEAGKKTNTQVTKVGYVSNMTGAKGSVYLHEGIDVSKLKKSGYTHLK